jgi:AcrR family transcriptional regulator
VVTDQRLVRGARARSAITRHAVDVASVEGLSGLTIGRLAADLGLSKSGVATLFGSKEQLQLATVETAREAFLEAVVRPASDTPPGTARLRALIERWISYAEQPLFPGGCFWAASLPDFDSRPGPVRDALQRQHQTWLALLAEQVRHAVNSGEMTNVDAKLAAFQIDAILSAANTAFRLGESRVAAKVRRSIRTILDCGQS